MCEGAAIPVLTVHRKEKHEWPHIVGIACKVSVGGLVKHHRPDSLWSMQIHLPPGTFLQAGYKAPSGRQIAVNRPAAGEEVGVLNQEIKIFIGAAIRSLPIGEVGPRGGGGFLMTPDAKWDDDLIDTCLVNPVGRLTMLYMLTRVMKGTHVTSRHVSMRQNQRITAWSSSPMPIYVDGEMFAYPRDNVHQVTITSLPAAVQVMV